MKAVKQKPKKKRYFSISPSDEFLRKIDILKAQFGENRSATLRRCVDIAYFKEIEAGKGSAKE